MTSVRFNMELLKILDENNFVSGQAIAEKLSISRAAVHKQISRLREKGYNIAGQKNMGYRIMSKPDALSADEIIPLLRSGYVIGSCITCYDKIPSTQLKAKEAADIATEGTVITAEEQTAGYGRLGRSWHSGRGGLWFSIILKPNCSPSNAPQIPLLIAIALCRSIEKLPSIKAKIKWPNDVFVEDKKVAGIITDISAEIDRLHWIVAGIGLNVNNDIPTELAATATSLKSAGWPKENRAKLLAVILCEFESIYKTFSSKGFAAFTQEFTERSILIGKAITVHSAGLAVRGVVKGFSHDGPMLLNTTTKDGNTYLPGDVTIEKPAAVSQAAKQPLLFGETL